MSNLELSWMLRGLFEYFPILLMLIRWLIFMFLDTSFTQFNNDQKGQRVRDQSASVSRDHIRKNAPGRESTRHTPLSKARY